MIASPSQSDIDAAIAAAVERITARAVRAGGAVAALGGALDRATRGGKRFRPALVIAAFDAFDGEDAHRAGALQVAAAFELLHTAFVVHDDVIDGDLQRRGALNVAGEFHARGRAGGADEAGAEQLGTAAAVLVGDLLLHEALRCVATAPIADDRREAVLSIVDDAIFVSAAGELADVEHAVAPEIADTTALLDAAHDKTAVYSFTAPMRAGAVLAGAGSASLDLLAHAGGRLGLAFQLVDDLIGAFGTTDQAGREPGVDLRARKRTPLLGLARTAPTWAQVDAAVAIAHTGPIAVRDAQRALEDSGARDQLIEMIGSTLEDVRTAARSTVLPPAAGGLLCELADAVERRTP